MSNFNGYEYNSKTEALLIEPIKNSDINYTINAHTEDGVIATLDYFLNLDNNSLNVIDILVDESHLSRNIDYEMINYLVNSYYGYVINTSACKSTEHRLIEWLGFINTSSGVKKVPVIKNERLITNITPKFKADIFIARKQKNSLSGDVKNKR